MAWCSAGPLLGAEKNQITNLIINVPASIGARSLACTGLFHIFTYVFVAVIVLSPNSAWSSLQIEREQVIDVVVDVLIRKGARPSVDTVLSHTMVHV